MSHVLHMESSNGMMTTIEQKTKHREISRFIKFAIVGIFATAVDFLVLNLLQATLLPPTTRTLVALASVCGYVTGIGFSYLCNSRWTYPDSHPGRVWVQFGQFFTVSIVAMSLRVLIVSLTYLIWAEAVQQMFAIDQIAANRLGTNLAQITAIGATMLWNFFANRYWTFGDVA